MSWPPTRKQFASLASRHEQHKRSCRLFLCATNMARLQPRRARVSTLEWPKEGFMSKSKVYRWVLGIAVSVFTAASYAQWSNPADDVPAYHPTAPLKVSALPPILAGAKLHGENFRFPWQVHVYQQAARIGNVLYQLPCNCRCDRALGHTSLRSCYEGLHGTECSTCAKEAFFAYRETKAGKTPAQIRAAINRREYESIDLERQ